MDKENMPIRSGRPPGTGIDDTPTLKAVAEILRALPGMRPTSAMKRCLKGVQATHLRRPQEKCKASGKQLLKEASKRARQTTEAKARAVAARAATVGHGEATAWKAVTGSVDLPGMKAALDHLDSPGMKALRLDQIAATQAFRKVLSRCSKMNKTSRFCTLTSQTGRIFPAKA